MEAMHQQEQKTIGLVHDDDDQEEVVPCPSHKRVKLETTRSRSIIHNDNNTRAAPQVRAYPSSPPDLGDSSSSCEQQHVESEDQGVCAAAENHGGGSCDNTILTGTPAARPSMSQQRQQEDEEHHSTRSSTAVVVVVDHLLPDDFLEPLPLYNDRSACSSNYQLTCKPTPLPLPPLHLLSSSSNNIKAASSTTTPLQLALTSPARRRGGCRQFWKAGDDEGERPVSTLTSAITAVAELLDNALDEIRNGATFVNVDMVPNPNDGSPMLLIEDDGGGMKPDSMRRCMSLGYSAKSKLANTIGQYGNGFKTSTMRLGSDVIVFSRCTQASAAGSGATQSIGLLSYSFLRDTCQEDIIVPMIDYELKPFGLRKLIRSSVEDWDCNLNTITKWSPFLTEADLLNQFCGMKSQGTKIVLFNLWEDDQGQLELDFESDPYDIQVRGANRDEKKIAMARRFPNSRHYLTYRHSLRSYASILYLRLPDGFRIILRGKDVEHHNLVDDMMFTQEHTYKPHGGGDSIQKEANMVAVITVGFVKDAKEHVDVQGFNVYHKNRLIKPFWRIWNSSSSQGRGVIGVLEANFVEPAHDKQGFERTIVLARLESRLLQLQKSYWASHCHFIGYYSCKTKGSSRTNYQYKGISSGASQESGVTTRKSASQSSAYQIPAMSESHPAHSALVGDKYTNMEREGCKCESEHCGSKGAVLAVERNVINIEKFQDEVEKNKQLESKVLDLEKKMNEIKTSMEIVVQERDALKERLEVELRQRASEDETLRMKLKDAYSRIQRLEAENKCTMGVSLRRND